MDRVDAIAGNVEALPLDQLVATGTRVLDTADALLASEGVRDLPPRLNAALEELRAMLAELNQGGAAENVNATLASASQAADAVTAAANELPALVARLNELANAADAALASVGPNSRSYRDTLLLLQEARDAARAVDSLVTALERRPTSVLFGR
jgi:paraquat-inducible protein B